MDIWGYCKHGRVIGGLLGCTVCRLEEEKAKRDAWMKSAIAEAIREAKREQSSVHTCPACMGKGVVRVVEGD